MPTLGVAKNGIRVPDYFIKFGMPCSTANLWLDSELQVDLRSELGDATAAVFAAMKLKGESCGCEETVSESAAFSGSCGGRSKRTAKIQRGEEGCGCWQESEVFFR